MEKHLKNQRGFTLIELIVIIAIIAILAAILIPAFSGFTERAREKSAISDARNILMAVEALLAEGKTSITETDSTITKSDIQSIAGDYKGTVYDLKIYDFESNVSFKYDLENNGKHYVVTVSNGQIRPEIDKSASASGIALN